MSFWKTLGSFFGGGASGSGQRETEPPRRPAAEEHFLELVARVATQLPHVQRFERSKDAPLQARAWLIGNPEPRLLNVDRLFQETRELDPESRSRAIARFVSSLTLEREELTWDEAVSCLMPVIRMSSFATGIPTVLVWRPFLPFVRLFVAIDHEDAISMVHDEQLQRWGQAPDELFDLAQRNLELHVKDSDCEPYGAADDGAIWEVTANDHYESSRLALVGYLASFRGRVQGNPIAIVPDRGRLVIGGDGDPNVIGRLARMAETEYEASTRAVSSAVYTVNDQGTVVPLHLPGDHPHHVQVERGHRLLAGSAYADQKWELTKRFESEQVALFVATLFLIVMNDSGRTLSWASLTEGVDAILPEADLLVLTSGEQSLLRVPWAAFLELAPGCLELDPQYDPPRWRTRAWPSESQLGALRLATETPG